MVSVLNNDIGGRECFLRSPFFGKRVMIMTEQNQQFLELYREYETVLREQGLDYFSVNELAEPPLLKNRLTMVRQMRNYLTHVNDVGFLFVTDEQIAFLKDLIRNQKLRGDLIRKHLLPAKKCAVSVTDSVFDALTLISKQELSDVFVLDEDRLLLKGMCSSIQLLKMYVKDTSACVGKIRRFSKNYGYCEPDSLVSDVLKRVSSEWNYLAVTSDGKAGGLFVGGFLIPASV